MEEPAAVEHDAALSRKWRAGSPGRVRPGIWEERGRESRAPGGFHLPFGPPFHSWNSAGPFGLALPPPRVTASGPLPCLAAMAPRGAPPPLAASRRVAL